MGDQLGINGRPKSQKKLINYFNFIFSRSTNLLTARFFPRAETKLLREPFMFELFIFHIVGVRTNTNIGGCGKRPVRAISVLITGSRHSLAAHEAQDINLLTEYVIQLANGGFAGFAQGHGLRVEDRLHAHGSQELS